MRKMRIINRNYLTLIALVIVILLNLSSILYISTESTRVHRSNDSNKSVTFPDSDYVPQTKEEADRLFDRLTTVSAEEEAEIRKNLKIPFTGFIENTGQKSNFLMKYYYSTDESYIHFEKSKIRFRQEIKDNLDQLNKPHYKKVENLVQDAKYLDFQISFVDANEVNPLAKYPLTHSTNYFTGKIHYTGISSYEEIWYHNIYDSIDLRYFMTDQGLKYEFIVHPGGNPADIAIQISETARLKVSNNRIGLYALDTNQYDEIIADTNLFVYETDTLIENEQNRSISIQSAFTLIDDKKQIYGYQISSYNPNNILVIDPLIMGYSALFGGNGLEQGNSIAVDGYGNVYITGYTYSTDFQTTMGAYNESINGADDVYVFKLNTAGNGLVYSTFLGGTGMDRANSITVDSTGDVYITGFTSNDTINFPTTPGAYNENHNGNWDVFVTKLNANGDMLIYSTFLGGNDNDAGLEIIIDSLGNAYLTGWTADDVIDFPITNGAYDELHNGNDDVFVCKLNNAGNVLVYSTFLGGSGTDRGSSITLDSLGNVYVTGTSMNSITDFPTTPGAFDETHNGGSFDVFVSKLNTDGEVLIYSTFLGGSGNDYSYGIEVDGFGNIYVAGRTISDTIDFPTTLGAYDRTHNGGTFDIFVSKLNSMGSGLIYSTYLGGNGGDEAWGMTIDDFSNVYITGHTYSINFPTTSGAYDETHNGEMDAFLSKFNTAGSGLVYSTFLGGSGSDQGKDIIVDSSGNVYITGVTTDDTIDFPTTNGVYDETHNGITDVFITKLHWKGYNTFLGGSSEDNSKSIAVDGSGNVYVTGQTLDSTTDFPTTSGAYDETYEAGRDAFIVKLNATGNGLVYSTFLGGNGQDYGQGIVIDSSGNVYVAGYTSSTNFPTTIGAYDETKSSNLDVFVTKLNANGDDLIYSTYLGEFSSEIANAIVVDSSGNAYVTGYTSSTDFPTTPGAYDETHNGVNDVFVFKLNSTGNGLVYSTFLGGSGSDYGNDITIDNSGNAYVTGRTDNDTIDFPTTSGAYDETHNGERDVFIFKLNTAGNGLVYSTFLGGSGIDQGNGITIDNSGNAYVTGSTLDGITDFPSTPGTYDEFHNDNDGQFDVFVSKLNAAGNGLVYSTFLGGSDSDEGQGIAIDSSGNVYVTGYTYSTNFPTSIEAFDETHNGVSDVFVAKLNATGNGLDYSTFLGGSGSDLGYSITVDSAGNVYITGRTYSVNFPTTNGPYDETYNGGAGDVFVFVNNLIIDTLEPNINKPEDLYYQLGQLGNTLMWDLVDLNPNYYNITLDGSILFSQIPWTNGLPSIVDVDGLSEGNHSVIITAVDKFGNTNSGLVYVIVDGYSPILTSPPNIYYKLGNTANTITWNLGDNNPDFYNITLDGIINVSDTSWTNGTVGINIDGLSEGVHTFIITVVDKSGNYLTDTVLVIVDGTLPDVSNPLNIHYQPQQTNNTITWNLGDNNPAFYSITLDGIINVSDTSWTNGTVGINIDGLSEGVHTFIITVVDKSGNYLTDTVLVIVDGTLPDVTSPSSINYSEFSIGNTITWLLGDKNPDVYNINQNGTPFEETTQWSNGSITINIDGLSLGVYEFSITVYDENGNFRPHTVIVTVIDDKIPSINLINGIVEGAIVEGSILIEITPSDEHGIERVEFLIDDIDACVDIADTTCDLNNDLYSLSLDTRNLNDGTHSLQIVVTDTANNSYTEVILFTVQNEVGSDGFNIPTVISIAIIALSGLGVTGGALRIRQRRRMDKAFDDLQSDFEGSEITGEGKSE